jgi:hypothetical protein
MLRPRTWCVGQRRCRPRGKVPRRWEEGRRKSTGIVPRHGAFGAAVAASSASVGRTVGRAVGSLPGPRLSERRAAAGGETEQLVRSLIR